MSLLASQKYRSPAWLPGVILLVLVSWFLLTTSYQGAINPNSGVTGGDFKFFYSAAVRLNTNQPLYEQQRPENSPEKNQEIAMGATYVYTPLLAILLKPIAAITGNSPDEVPMKALKLWFCISFASLAMAVFLFARAMRWTLDHAALIAICAITAVRFWPTTMTFGLGQTNLLLVFTLAGIFYADSKDRLLLAAFFIALGALFKTWFIAFLLYLFVRRAWKAASACVAFSLLGLVLLFAFVGFHEFPLFFSKTVGYASKQMGNQVLSQSIAGFAQLHFTPNDHIHPLINSPFLAVLFKLAGYVAMLCGAAFLFFIRPPLTLADKQLRLALVSLTVLLLLPYSQNEYLVLALPAIWLLLTQFQSGGWIGLFGATVAYVLLTRGGPYYPNNAKAFQDGLRSLVVSVPFAALCLLWITLLFSILHRAKATSKIATPEESLVRTSTLKPQTAGTPAHA